jgi:hypothetical protein
MIPGPSGVGSPLVDHRSGRVLLADAGWAAGERGNSIPGAPDLTNARKPKTIRVIVDGMEGYSQWHSAQLSS